jgi:protein gp37
MGQDSKIEWTHHTFNPWRGCTKVSPGCANCYADAQSKRNPGVLGVWGPEGSRVVASEGGPAGWSAPLKWDRLAAAAGERHRVFCASMADVFEEWDGPMLDASGRILNRAPVGDGTWTKDRWWICDHTDSPRITMDDVRERLFKLIESTPHLDWLLLTKRADQMSEFVRLATDSLMGVCSGGHFPTDFPNVWLGVSVENQEQADKRIPQLLATPAAVRFLSVEPLLGPIQLDRLDDGKNGWVDCLGGVWGHGFSTDHEGDGTEGIPDGITGDGIIHWVIVGGESGHHARPMHTQWVRSIRDQCQATGVAFFFKQWGEWAPYSDVGTGTLSETEILGDKMAWLRPDGQHSTAQQRPAGYAGAPLVSKLGKHAAGRQLDGREWSEFPVVQVPSERD